MLKNQHLTNPLTRIDDQMIIFSWIVAMNREIPPAYRNCSVPPCSAHVPMPQDGTRQVNALFLVIILLLLSSGLPACSTAAPKKDYSHPTQKPYVINNRVYYPIPSSYGFTQTGIASWYGDDFHGRKTSNAETYNMYDMTAAHKTLPMNTVLLVKNLENNKEIVVRVNDRGPFVRGRVIDLSYTAAKKVGIIGRGTARVHLTALGDAHQGSAELRKLAKTFQVGEFYIQIGSFADRNNALRLQQRFTQAGHTTLIQQYYGPDKIYYRVHVYVGKTLNGAERERKILESRGYRDAFVIAH
jgi:rare lipoprotein A